MFNSLEIELMSWMMIVMVGVTVFLKILDSWFKRER